MCKGRGGGGGGAGARGLYPVSDQPTFDLVLLWSISHLVVRIVGRFLAHKCNISEIQKSKLKLK